MPDLRLTYEEQRCSLHTKLMMYLDEQLYGLRKQNDGDKSVEETAKLRGRIAEVKSLQALLVINSKNAD